MESGRPGLWTHDIEVSEAPAFMYARLISVAGVPVIAFDGGARGEVVST